MEHNNNYLSDEELEALICDVEAAPLMEAPAGLKQNILAKLPTDIASKKKKMSARLELMTFSMKIVLSAAAAIAFLLLIPVPEHNASFTPAGSRKESSTEFLETANMMSSQFCAFLYEKSNTIFQKEDFK